MVTSNLYPLIEEAIQNHDWAVSQFPAYFENLSNTCPIVWFGDLASNAPKIITFGSNPSDKEFHDDDHQLLKRPRFPKFINRGLTVTAKSMSPAFGVAQNIEEDDNDYFKESNNPYMGWFRPLHNFAKEYYKDVCEDPVCIHLDALPFATSKKFKDLKRNTESLTSNPHFQNFGDVLDWGADFAHRLLQEIVDADQVLGIVLIGRENIRQFKSIFKRNIFNVKEGDFFVKRNFAIEKFEVNIGLKTIEVIGTTIYLPNSHLGNALNTVSLVSAIKQL